MSKRLRHAALIAFATALAVAASAADAGHSWNGYHWARTTSPFTLKLGDNLNGTWDPFLATTSSDWSVSAVLDTTIVAGGTKPRNCRATLGRVEVCNASYGNTGWLGVAQISISGSHIRQGTVKVNDTYFNTTTYNSPAWRNLVMCQEVGHTLGLGHTDENFNNTPQGTCMDYSNDPTPNQHPDQHDYEELAAIYQHLDSSTTVGQALPPAMQLLDLSEAKNWGRLVQSRRGGQVETFVLDFGGAHKVITHVIWAAGERGKGREE